MQQGRTIHHGLFAPFLLSKTVLIFVVAVLRVLLFQLCQILIGFLFRLEAHLWSLGAEL